MPVCSRCTGIYIGFLASLCILMAVERKIRSGFPPKKLTISFIIFFSLMAAESVLSFLGLTPALNILRFATGYLAGWFISPMIIGLANSVSLDKKLLNNGSYLKNIKPLAIWVTAIIPFAALFYFTFEKAIIFWSVFSLTGLALFIALMVFIIVFASSRQRANSLTSPGKYILFLFISILISAAFILLSSTLKTAVNPYIRLFVLGLLPER